MPSSSTAAASARVGLVVLVGLVGLVGPERADAGDVDVLTGLRVAVDTADRAPRRDERGQHGPDGPSGQAPRRHGSRLDRRGARRQRFPRSSCSRSMASKSAWKLPLPKPSDPCRSISSKNTVGRSPSGRVKICRR